MNVEIRCPDCHSVWSVHRSAGGEMLCPSCMTRIPLDGSTTVDPGEGAVSEEQASAMDLPPTVECEIADSTPDSAANEAAGRAEAPVAAEPPSGVAEARPAGPTAQASSAEPAAAAAAPRPDPRPVERHVERKTILVVDDLAYFRQIAKDALQPTFDVKTAATSAEAREIMARGGIDLLVLDLTLDGCNAGRDFLAELKPKPCPILIFTAQDESEMYGENWERLERLGADDLVIKGMRVAESLTRKASTLLGFSVDDEEPIG
jgi:CheY-like chemotaxis protein